MKRCCEIREVLVKVSFIGATQLFATIGIALARDDPPPSSVRPWAPPGLPRYEGELREYEPTEAERRYLPAIDPRKTYNLAELIDIAQRTNPETRVAWERARMAAAAVGLTESAYYPYIVAAAAGGYDRAFIPFPTLRVKQQAPPTNDNLPNVEIVGGGTLVTESLLARAELNAKWLLIDFGERNAIRAAAREKLMMANVGFNGTHQKIVFDVTDRFYQLGTARQKVMVTQSALGASQTVEQAAQARFDNGLATKPELLQAQQQSAQSNFDLQASLGAESDARVALIESIGLMPTVQLKVADLPRQSGLDAQGEDSVGSLITKALAQRPDLVAKLANVRSKEYEIRRPPYLRSSVKYSRCCLLKRTVRCRSNPVVTRSGGNERQIRRSGGSGRTDASGAVHVGRISHRPGACAFRTQASCFWNSPVRVVDGFNNGEHHGLTRCGSHVVGWILLVEMLAELGIGLLLLGGKLHDRRRRRRPSSSRMARVWAVGEPHWHPHVRAFG